MHLFAAPHRTVGLGLAAALALGAITGVPASASASNSVDQSARAAKDFRPVAKLKAGKRSVRFLACTRVRSGAFDVRYKAIARKPSDRAYPRVELQIGTSSTAEFALFPGDSRYVGNSSPHAANEVLKVSLFLKGKKKKKQVLVGKLGRC